MIKKKSKAALLKIVAAILAWSAFETAIFFRGNISSTIKIVLLALPIICFILHFVYILRRKKDFADELKNKIKAEAAVYSKIINFYSLLFLAIFFRIFEFNIPVDGLFVLYLCYYLVVLLITEMLVESKYL